MTAPDRPMREQKAREALHDRLITNADQLDRKGVLGAGHVEALLREAAAALRPAEPAQARAEVLEADLAWELWLIEHPDWDRDIAEEWKKQRWWEHAETMLLNARAVLAAIHTLSTPAKEARFDPTPRFCEHCGVPELHLHKEGCPALAQDKGEQS